MTVEKQLIDKVESIKTTLNEISVYNLDVKTSLELYYELAKKVNEVINELSRFEGVVSDEVVEQNKKLIYLLGEGLKIEVGLKIDELITNGTIQDLINNKIFNELNNKIELYKQQTDEQFNTNKSLEPFTTIKEDESIDNDSTLLQKAIETSKQVYISKNMLLTNQIVIENKNNIELFSNKNFTIKAERDIISIVFRNCKNIKIHDLIYDGSLQKEALQRNDNIFIYLENCENIRIYDNTLKNGSYGIKLKNTKNVEFNSNIAYGFSAWPVYFDDLENAKIYNNYMHDNDYDGLKGTGFHYNVDVYSNNCYNNKSDGYDFAGHSCNGLRIFNNNFYDNLMEGIEVKTLNRSVYPLPSDIINPVFENIEIIDNKLITNKCGVNMANMNSNEMTSKNILIKNNKISTNQTSANSGLTGIRLSMLKCLNIEDLIIDNNIITNVNMYYGVRVQGCEKVLVKCNNIRVFQNGVLCEIYESFATDDIIIEDNKIVVENSNCIRLNADTTKCVVRKNYLKSPSTSYRLNDLASSNLMYENYVNDRVSSLGDSYRGTKGEILYSSDVASSNCLGWICTTTGTNLSYWKQFGVIS